MVERTMVVQVLGDNAAALDVVAGKAMGQRLILSLGTFVIGRDSDADLELTDEAGVSRVHAKISSDGQRYRLADNESRNGTLLNGKPIANAVLTDGDTITIGECTIIFRQPSTRRAPGQQAPSVKVMDGAPAMAAAAPAAPARKIGPLYVVAGVAVASLLIGGTALVVRMGSAPVPVPVPLPVAVVAPTPPPVPVPVPVPVAPEGPAFTPATSETHTETLRVGNRGGRVQSLAVKVGDVVTKDAVIAVVAGEAGNAADIATRKESIAALTEIAEGNERAAKQLATEKAELQAIMAKAPSSKITTPVAGTVSELFLKVGEAVRSGQVVAKVGSEDTTVRTRVTSEIAGPLAVGTPCELQLSGGATAMGTLRSKADRGAGQIELLISAGKVAGVTGARCR